ncbi:MAG: hypothetical protein ACRYFL_03895 [Janthinobacterium lividum]
MIENPGKQKELKNEIMKIGYARVSTQDQNLDLQLNRTYEVWLLGYLPGKGVWQEYGARGTEKVISWRKIG